MSPLTRYVVEPAPGQPRDPKLGWSGAGWRVVAVTGERRCPFLTRFRKREHAMDEARRLTDRDAALLRPIDLVQLCKDIAMAPYQRS